MKLELHPVWLLMCCLNLTSSGKKITRLRGKIMKLAALSAKLFLSNIQLGVDFWEAKAVHNDSGQHSL